MTTQPTEPEHTAAAGQPAIPPENLPPVWAGQDERPAPPLVGDEREILTSFLDWHRRTFELKCAGVEPERLSEKSVPPSGLSLHGLIRHLAGVEHWWLRVQFAGERDDFPYYSDDHPDQDFEMLEGDVEEELAFWRAECAHSRKLVAAAPSLDATGTHAASGQPVALRRILVHLIAEYARHNGHADLLRERLDGATGV
ncbi:DinB family protein [Streptomyces purpurogeneiscleroticus]|uniref:DinB family protein n=1 Tax=Streptomyces purpurogeneiscleroticus TaxID=68259 RepID=UPI001CC0530C|nr:DinB family protein [Streptomyces purpurogeneiscleroticus]MBZ4014413.1 Mini-circle protein [Streptomyces purpurogeneiscleroticus]